MWTAVWLDGARRPHLKASYLAAQANFLRAVVHGPDGEL